MKATTSVQKIRQVSMHDTRRLTEAADAPPFQTSPNSEESAAPIPRTSPRVVPEVLDALLPLVAGHCGSLTSGQLAAVLSAIAKTGYRPLASVAAALQVTGLTTGSSPDPKSLPSSSPPFLSRRFTRSPSCLATPASIASTRRGRRTRRRSCARSRGSRGATRRCGRGSERRRWRSSRR